MAGAKLFSVMATAAPLLLGAALTWAQAPGSLNGKLTDLHSKPMAGATVVLRNQETGAELRSTTAGNGSYRFEALPAGRYTLEAEAPGLGAGRFEEIAVASGYELRLQTALRFEARTDQRASFPPAPARPRFVPQPEATRLDALLEPPPSSTRLLPLAERVAPAPLPPLPAQQPPVLMARLEAAENPSLALPARRLLPRLLPEPAVPTLEAALPAPELAALEPVRLGAWPVPAPPTVRLLNQLWGGEMGFAAGVAAMATLRPALAALTALTSAPSVSDPVAPLVASNLDAEQLQALPLAGRRWLEALPQAPPAPEPPDFDGEGSSSGHKRSATALTVDGASRQLAFGPQAAEHAGSVSESAVESAEFNQSSAESPALDPTETIAALKTRQGGEKLHGQLFAFTRQRLWSARNPFAFWVKQSAPATSTAVPTFTAEPFTPSDQEFAWGFGLGGRLRARRFYWYAALDSNHRDDPGLASVRHPDQFFAQPTNDKLQVLSARLGLSTASPITGALKQYSAMLETLAGLLGPTPRQSQYWSGFARLDWLAGERHRLSAELSEENRDSQGGGWNRLIEYTGNHSFGNSSFSSQWLLLRWQAYLTPDLLAVTQASFGRTLLSRSPSNPSTYESSLLSAAWERLPQIVVDSTDGFTIGTPATYGSGSNPDERRIEVRELLEWAGHNLLVKAGIQLNHNQDDQGYLRNQTGTYHYANLLNFASDALAFQSIGLAGQLDPYHQHNCDQTGRVWRDSTGQLRGLGYLPCYSYYTQTMGPTNWWLRTNDWTGFATAQWQPAKQLVLSAGLRWQRQVMPPPIERLRNSDLPQAALMPSPGNELAPRIGLAWGSREGYWPVLRLGYGIYFGRTQNSTLMTALTHTGSTAGDLAFYLRPTDNLNAGGAPPFPYVLTGEPTKMVKPGAVEFAPGFRNGQVHQALLGLEESLPFRIRLTASAMLSLGRRLPVTLDTNLDPFVNPGSITYEVVDPGNKGPIKQSTLTVPFYASWPSTSGLKGRANSAYQQIVQIQSRANSVYEAYSLRLDRYGQRGLSTHLRYTYAHAMDWNPNESTEILGSDVLDPAHFENEYGTSDLDLRHSLVGSLSWQPTWRLSGLSDRLFNGWRLTSTGQFHSGRPFTMRTSSNLVHQFVAGKGTAIAALGSGMNGSGGDNRVYGVGRNTYRYPATWKIDLRLARQINLGSVRQLNLILESFNLFNHRNVTRLESIGYSLESGTTSGGLPQLNFKSGTNTGTSAFGQPLDINATSYFRERKIQFGLRYRF